MKALSKCCRSAPRCADCPVLVVARQRFVRRNADPSVFMEIFGHTPSHRLPEPVQQALLGLEERRTSRFRRDVRVAS